MPSLAGRFTAASLQEILGIPREAWRRIAASKDMPKPEDAAYTRGVTKWQGQFFARRLAVAHPELASRVPVLLRPAPEGGRRRYLRGAGGDADGLGSRVTLRWETPGGVVAVVYPLGTGLFSPSQILEAAKDPSTVVLVKHGYNLWGPELVAVDGARPDVTYELLWSELAAHVGDRVPWWQASLRRPEHMTAWHPGSAVASVEVTSFPSGEPLYDMAYREAEGSVVRTACLTLGQDIRREAISTAMEEISEMLALEADADEPEFSRRSVEAAARSVPAVPDTDDPSLTESGTPEQVREGIAELCRRVGDPLAVECLNTAAMWSRNLLPVGGACSLDLDDATPRHVRA